MRLTPCIVLLGMVARLAQADVYLYRSATTHVPHEVISSSLNFKVTHPFRVVIGGSDQVTGILMADLKDPTQGMALELNIPTASLQTVNAKVNARIARLLNTQAHPTLKFISSRTDITHIEGTEHYGLIFDGNLELGEAVSPQRVDLHCRTEGGALVCTFDTMMAPSGLGIPLPKLGGIVTENKVEVTGQITFRAQK